MTTTPSTSEPVTETRVPAPSLWCPFDLKVAVIAAFVNGELDHDVYDGVELQWFDDDVHGRGLLAFLSRRADRRVDYYLTEGLRLDPATYEIGGGTGGWDEIRFERDLLEVTADGVRAEVRFHDRDGRLIEIALDDTDAGPRRTGELLAPVGAAIESPVSLGLVFLQGFDLLRRTSHRPRIAIDGIDVPTGTLPGRALHRRHLIKAAGPLVVATVCPAGTRTLTPVDPSDPAPVVLTPDGQGIAGLRAGEGDRTAELSFVPPLPSLDGIAADETVTGTWTVEVVSRPITGGNWSVTRRGDDLRVDLQVTRPWRPAPGLPPLLRIVTRVLPVFRRWPTTYRWSAEIQLDAGPTVVSRWERTGDERGDSYRRATHRS
ncbi:MAG: hypothetical protein JJT89_05665 [Nitriliruptoraceae bacterium]|nr:hypothetical protein [Nitriliruptoraceae bacterium]